MPSKVVVTVTNDLNQDQRMHRICNSLVSAGYEVVLIGRNRKQSLPLMEQVFGQKRLSCWFDSGILFYIEYNVRLFFFLLFRGYDLVYSVDLDTISTVSMISLLRSKRHIHDAHEYFVEVPELEHKRLKKWIWNRVAFTFLKRCSLRFTVNKELADALSQRYGQPFITLRSLPRRGDNHPKIEKQKIVLYQGVLNKGRGLEQAIKAIANMEEDIQLHIAGEGDLSEELRAIKQEVDTMNKVRFLGWKLPEELKTITKDAWIGLNLLECTSLNYKYSLANKFFDYMHAGVPSINMDFPVYRRYCSEMNVGICIQDLSEEAIITAIRSLNDTDSYDVIARNAINARKSICWEVEEQILLENVSKILSV